MDVTVLGLDSPCSPSIIRGRLGACNVSTKWNKAELEARSGLHGLERRAANFETMLPFVLAGEYEKARALLDDLKEVINTLKGVHGRLFDGHRQ